LPRVYEYNVYTDGYTDEKICSGDEIILRTCDAHSFPLPYWDLLEMQRVLQCIAAMSGSVEPRDESYDGDDSLPGDSPTMANFDDPDSRVECKIYNGVGSTV
jgi:hypothetical protein